MKKHARTCAGCRQTVRARYRAIVDEFLCQPCWDGWFTQRAEQRASVDPSEPDPPPSLQPPSAANEELEMFDLSHLVPK